MKTYRVKLLYNAANIDIEFSIVNSNKNAKDYEIHYLDAE